MRQPNITNPLCTAGTLAANLLDPEPYLYTSAITGDTRAYRGALYPTPSTTRYAYSCFAGRYTSTMLCG